MLEIINSILSTSFENKKYTTNDILLKYINDDNAFVTFTSENKLGINPHSYYTSTPLGIYCYPIKLSYKYYNSKDNFLNSLPFANKQPYFIIFKVNNNSKILTDNYSEDNFNSDFNILKEKYDLKIDIDKLNNNFKNNYNINHSKFNNIPCCKLYYLLYNLANNNMIKWNKLFRELGYTGFIDSGYEIIHENIPCQAVFFSTSNLEIIEAYNNKG